MATSMDDDFDKWLSKKLIELNPDTDLDVFVQYIRSILESESEDSDELHDSISGIIEEINDSNVDEQCGEIIQQWQSYKGAPAQTSQTEGKISVEEQISSIMTQQQQTVTKAKVMTSEDRARQEAKRAILNQYAEVSDGETSDSEADTKELSANVNSKMVLDREKATRDKNKQEAESKRQKDKTDREKQKQKAEDRKEAEKKRTQKGERRR